MAEGILTDIAMKVLENLGKSALQEAAAWWGARGDLNKLEDSLRLIKARVRDAENRREEEGSEVIREWLARLRQVLYQADDLFDEVMTVNREQQPVKGNTNSLAKQVGMVFSSSSRLYFNLKMAQEIKSIRGELDAIKSDMAGLNLRETVEPPQAMARLMNEREMISFAQTDDVVGRKDDKNKVIDMLLDPIYARERVCVIPIVGFGGVGKTTLAQMVFNDERVKKCFDLTKWACVPDVDKRKEVLGKVCESFTGEDYHRFSMKELQAKLRDSVLNKKYLLVLDDVWDESRDEWLCLLSLLKCGALGSKVIVTTRSEVVATNVGTVPPYKLGLLTDDESWLLFKRLAFRTRHDENRLSQIGQEIVQTCGNLPLAIRAVGSFLYSKESENEWQYVRAQLLKGKLTKGSKIIPQLKLSYDCLAPALKKCFAYCSLFPKGHSFSKVKLVRLWIAQGYIEPSEHQHVDLEEVGDQYFLKLKRRNFFQEFVEDEGRAIRICKMHDLVHDLARHVAGEEIMVVNECKVQINKRILHINVHSGNDVWGDPQPLRDARNIRSLLFTNSEFSLSYDRESYTTFPEAIFSLRSLRALDVGGREIEMIPDSIEKLKHLRYLSLSPNPISSLPDGILRLENLQTLDLSRCGLTELPKKFTRLHNLRHLEIPPFLTDLPLGFEEMKSLRELNLFIVGRNNGIDALSDLNLRGTLRIHWHKWRTNAVMEAERANLKDKQLTSLSQVFWSEVDEAKVELLLKSLKLPPKLEEFRVWSCLTKEFPSQMLDKLNELVEVVLTDCKNCRVLPLLSPLPHLRVLKIWKCEALEYIEDVDIMGESVGVSCSSTFFPALEYFEDVDITDEEGYGVSVSESFFPALEYLELKDLPELKRWSRVEEPDDVQLEQWLSFPCLSKLRIENCPQLVSLPLMPKLQTLDASVIRGYLLASILTSHKQTSSSSSTLPMLKTVIITSAIALPSLSINVPGLELLDKSDCDQLSTLTVGSQNAIRDLTIKSCRRLRNLSEGLQHLSVLENLRIESCDRLDIWDDYDNAEDRKRVSRLQGFKRDDGNAEDRKIMRGWLGLTSLRSLKLYFIMRLESLPREIACLTALQNLNLVALENLKVLPEQIGHLSQLRDLGISSCKSLTALPEQLGNLSKLCELYIWNCPKLKALPQSFCKLTSLHRLRIDECPRLEMRCRRPDGKDWPLIQHIPDVSITSREPSPLSFLFL